MTTAADDSAVEDAFEAFLAGRPVPVEAAGTFDGVAAFAAAVRATATRPGRPNAALAELLATGLLTDQSSPSARTAISAASPPPRSAARVRRRRRFVFIPALIAKILSAGAVAQAATGAGIAVVVATGAGATGLLGTDMQDTLTSVVAADETAGTEDPADLTDGAADETTAPETTAPETTAPETTAPAEPTGTEGQFDAETWATGGPAEGEPFGAWVTAGAHDPELKAALRAEGLSFGDVVSEWAHRKGENPEDYLTDAPTTTPAEPTATESEDGDAGTQVATTERGKGNGNGGHGGGRGKN